jgi:hypothetical protein
MDCCFWSQPEILDKYGKDLLVGTVAPASKL